MRCALANRLTERKVRELRRELFNVKSQYMGRKKKAPFGAVPMQPRQQNAVASSASKPHSLNLRLGRPSAPLHLILCKLCLDIFAYAIPLCAKMLRVFLYVGRHRVHNVLWSLIPEHLIPDVPFRGPGDQSSVSYLTRSCRWLPTQI
jgi:hypothetical protein